MTSDAARHFERTPTAADRARQRSSVTQVNDLLQRFNQMRKLMKNTGKMKRMMAQMSRMKG